MRASVYGVLHIQAGLVLCVQLLIDRGQLPGEMLEGVVPLPVGQFIPGAALFPAPELFDLPHGAMHRTQLPLELRDEIELMSDEYFRFEFEILDLRGHRSFCMSPQ